MDREDKCFITGLVVGLVLMLLIWITVSSLVEGSKVECGYLTFKHKTYTVTLHDTLDIPEKENENESQ